MWLKRNESISSYNTRWFYITEVIRALYFFVPIWVAYERQYINLWEFTLIEAIMVAVSLALELPTGAFADLVGKRWSIVIGYVFSVLSLVVFGLSRNFEWFVIYAILTGFGDAFISGAHEALIYDSLKQDGKEELFDKVNAKMAVIFQCSYAVSVLIGGYLGAIAYSIPIWLMVGVKSIHCILCFFFREPHIDTEKFTLKRYIHQTKIGAMELVKNDHIKKISLFYILVGFISWVCQLVFNLTLLTEVGHTPTEIGWIIASLRIINSIVLFRLIHISSLFTKSRTFLMFPIVMIISLLPGIFVTRWTVIPTIALIMFISTARWSILGKYTNQEFDSRNRATAISTLSMAINIFYIITLFLAGPIMEFFGGVKIMFTLLGLLSIVTVLPLGIHLAKLHRIDTGR